MTNPKTWYRYEKGNKKDKNMTICFSELKNDRNGVFSSEGLTTPDDSQSTPVDSPSLFTVMNESHEIVKDPLDGVVTESPEKKHESDSLQSEDSWDGMHITKQKTPTDNKILLGNKPTSPLSEEDNTPKDDLSLQRDDSWAEMHLWDSMRKKNSSTPTGMGSTNDTKQATLGEAVTSLAGATTNTVNNIVKQGKDKATETLSNIKGELSKQLGKLQALLDKQQGGAKRRITKRRKLKIKRKLNKSYKKNKVRRRKNKTRRKMNKKRNKSRRHN